MQIPLQYNFRNLFARKSSTFLTVLGVALVVWVFILSGGIVQNLRENTVKSGEPDNLLVLHKDATEIISSNISQGDLATLRSYPDFSIVAPESTFGVMETEDLNTGTGFLMTHGIKGDEIAVHPSIRISEGRMFAPSSFEIIVSKSMTQSPTNLHIGQTAKVGPNSWTVVGIYDAQGSAWDGAIIMDRDMLDTNFKLGRIQSVTAKLKNPADADRVIQAIADDHRMNLHAERETEYYARHTQTANQMQGMGMLVSIIIAIGATFGAVNTLYAAVAARGREIGTLRALGFSRRSVLLSFLLEGILLSGTGGLLGCIFGLFSGGFSFRLPEQAVGVLSVHPSITPSLLLGALIFSVVLGAIGGIFPAMQAARLEITQALKKV